MVSMMSSQEALLLTRTDPARNMARFYVLSVEPALFAGAALLRQWGRIGTRGRTRVELFANEAEARQALMRLAAAKTRRLSCRRIELTAVNRFRRSAPRARSAAEERFFGMVELCASRTLGGSHCGTDLGPSAFVVGPGWVWSQSVNS